MDLVPGPLEIKDGDATPGSGSDGGNDLGVLEGGGVAATLEASFREIDAARRVGGDDQFHVDGLGGGCDRLAAQG